MARQLLQHVVEKPDAGLDVVHAGAVEADLGLDAGLPGVALDAGPAHWSFSSAALPYGGGPENAGLFAGRGCARPPCGAGWAVFLGVFPLLRVEQKPHSRRPTYTHEPESVETG